MTELPTGAVTLLFTDIEGSTRLLDVLGPRFGELMVEHRRQLRDAVAAHGGLEVGTRGDGHCAVFTDPAAAIRAAVDVQLAVAGATWPDDVTVRVRMGLHTGDVGLHRDEYYGIGLHAAARVGAVAHGGQILVSEETQRLVGGAFVFTDLGYHVLKDLGAPCRLFQVVHPELDGSFPPPATLSVLPNNLPATLTSFVGRDGETAELRELLRSRRLVTVRGPGGIGKTRLALQVAAQLVSDFEQGVWFVDLAAHDPTEPVVDAVARAVHVRDVSGRPLRDVVQERLAWQHVLLVVDNCEHVIDDSADLIASLLRNCPRAAVLATSRSALDVPGECVFDLGPLDAGDADGDAVRLFVQRTTSGGAGVRLRPDDLPAIATLCERLDGLPLAIELAAARSNVLSVDQLVERISTPRFLQGGRGVPERQKSLDALIDWSHQLLDPGDRIVFRRLAVFHGSVTLDVAEAVCGGEGGFDVIDALGNLVDASLITLRRDGDAVRYRLLETIRLFAQERLAESGELDVIRERHRDAFAALAVRARAELERADQAVWLDRLDEDSSNIIAAVDWSLEHGRPEEAARLVGTLRRFWLERGHLRQALGWARRLADELTPQSPEWVEHLTTRGVLEGMIGDPEQGEACLRRAIALAETGSDDRLTERAHSSLGVLLDRNGDFEGAAEQQRLAAVAAQRTGDLIAQASAVGNLGNVALRLGDLDQAEALHQQVLELIGGVAVRIEANSLNSLGLIAWTRGDLESAKTHIEGAIEIIRRVGTGGLALALVNLAGVMREMGDIGGALDVQRESLEIAERVGDPLSIASGLQVHGVMLWDIGEREAAFANWTRALDIARAARASETLMSALLDLGEYHVAMGDPDRAQAYADELLELARSTGAPRREADALGLQAEIEAIRGDGAAALDLAKRARTIFEDIEDARGLRIALFRVALAAAVAGDADEAYARYEEAGSDLPADDPWEAVWMLETKATIAARLGDRPGADAVLAELSALVSDQVPWLRARAAEVIADVKQLLGAEAEAELSRAEAAAIRANAPA